MYEQMFLAAGGCKDLLPYILLCLCWIHSSVISLDLAYHFFKDGGQHKYRETSASFIDLGRGKETCSSASTDSFRSVSRYKS